MQARNFQQTQGKEEEKERYRERENKRKRIWTVNWRCDKSHLAYADSVDVREISQRQVRLEKDGKDTELTGRFLLSQNRFSRRPASSHIPVSAGTNLKGDECRVKSVPT